MARIFNIITQGAGVRLSKHTTLISIIIIVVSLTIELPSVHGRKCVCTSKSCLEAGTDTCRTRFSCYTELILIDEGQGNTTTRGCTEKATPLLCESRPRMGSLLDSTDATLGHLRVRWPRLRCCDSHDYCNGVGDVDFSTGVMDHRKFLTTSNSGPNSNREDSEISNPADVGSSQQPSDPPDRYRDNDGPFVFSTSKNTSDYTNNGGMNSYSNLKQVKPLHIAALVLAVAALISVLAACYVINRVLRSPYPPQVLLQAQIRSEDDQRRSQVIDGKHLDFRISREVNGSSCNN